MDIGKKIKALRHQCNLTQEELANRCELTKGYISQLENELTSPSIATLKDVLAALGTNLKEFFAEEEEEKIIFKDDDFIERTTDDFKLNWLVPNAQKNMLEPISVELYPKKTTEPDVPHEGEEFGYVIKGQLTLYLDEVPHTVKEGESFYYSCSKKHQIINNGNTNAVFLWVSTPPSF